jgi:hypothetical protein
MPNQMNYIAVPEAMKGQLEEQGTIEIDYTLVDEGGVQYLKVVGVEGQPIADEPETPESRLKKKIGYKEESEEETSLMM